MKKWLLVLIVLGGLLIALASSLVVVVIIWWSQPVEIEKVPEIPKLRPKIAESANAWGPLLEASKVVKVKKELVFQGLKKLWANQPDLINLLKDNERALKLLDQGLSRGQLVIPEVKFADETFPYLSKWRYLGSLKCLKAHKLMAQGQREEGLKELLDVVQFGHLVQNSYCPLIHYLVGTALKAIGSNQLRCELGRIDKLRTDFIPRPGHVTQPPVSLHLSGWNQKTIALWRRAIQELARYESSALGLANSFATEYEMVREVLMNPAQIGETYPDLKKFVDMPRSPLYNRDKTILIARKYYARWIEQAKKPYWKQESIFMPELEEPKGMFDKLRFFVVNPLGRLLLVITLPVFERMTQRQTWCDADVLATKVQIAIKCYAEKRKRLPHSLAELVPKYLDDIPIDPFDGKPLRYLPKHGIVYSAGPNGIDENGLTGTGEEIIKRATVVFRKDYQGDLVFPLPFVHP